jgi:hypothetical protein
MRDCPLIRCWPHLSIPTWQPRQHWPRLGHPYRADMDRARSGHGHPSATLAAGEAKRDQHLIGSEAVAAVSTATIQTAVERPTLAPPVRCPQAGVACPTGRTSPTPTYPSKLAHMSCRTRLLPWLSPPVTSRSCGSRNWRRTSPRGRPGCERGLGPPSRQQAAESWVVHRRGGGIQPRRAAASSYAHRASSDQRRQGGVVPPLGRASSARRGGGRLAP